MKRIDKILLYILGGTLPLALILFYIYSVSKGPSTRQLIMARDSLEEFNGVVDSLYYDVGNHNVKVAVLNSKYTFEILREWEPKIQLGDSLYKKKGIFLIEVVRKRKRQDPLDYKTTIPKK